MSGAFTIPLKRVIELTGGELAFDTGVAVMTGGNIGLDFYPLHEPSYRPTLNGKIIDHYLNREIGVETIDMFQQVMRRTMNEIMPAYNELYRSAQFVFDPMRTIDITTLATTDSTQTSESSSQSNAETESTTTSRAIDSNFPQTILNGSGDYASNGSDVVGSGDSDSTANTSDEAETTAHAIAENETTGYQGSPADLLMRYRESIINIDLMVINDLEDCFMQIFDNGSTYTRKGYWY